MKINQYSLIEIDQCDKLEVTYDLWMIVRILFLGIIVNIKIDINS